MISHRYLNLYFYLINIIYSCPGLDTQWIPFLKKLYFFFAQLLLSAHLIVAYYQGRSLAPFLHHHIQLQVQGEKA